MPFPTTSEQKELDARIVELEYELLELKRRRNGLSPISQIPREILCDILLLATTFNGEPQCTYANIHLREERCIELLAHVCHTWRAVALGSPQLWAEIDIFAASDPEQVEFFVKHAHPLPLSFCIQGGSETLGWSASEASQRTPFDIVRRTISEAKRSVDELTCIGTPEFLVSSLALCPEGRDIQAIRVIPVFSGNPDWWYSVPAVALPQCPLVTAQVPSLRVLNFTSCEVPLTLPILFSPNLTSIELVVPPQSNAFHVLDMLRKASQLRFVDLTTLHDFISPPSVLPLVAAQLPKLASMVLRGKSTPLLVVLEHLSLPAKNVDILISCCVPTSASPRRTGEGIYSAIGNSRRASVKYWLDQNQPFSPTLLSIAHSFVPGGFFLDAQYLESSGPSNSRLQSSTRIDITLFYEETGLDVDIREWLPIFLVPRSEDISRNIGWSLDALRSLLVVKPWDNCPPILFWSLMSSLRTLLELYIDGSYFYEFLPSLRTKYNNTHGEQIILPFPQLRRVNVGGSWPSNTTLEDVLEPMVSVLEDRLELAVECDAGTTGALECVRIMEPLKAPSASFKGVLPTLINRVNWIEKLEPLTEVVETA